MFGDGLDSLCAEGDDICGGSDVAFVLGAAFVLPVWAAGAGGVGVAFAAVCAVVFFDLCCDDDPEGGSFGVWVGHFWLVFLFFPAFDDGFAEVASGFVEALVVVIVGSACQVAGVLGVADAADGLVFVCMFHQFSPESVGGSWVASPQGRSPLPFVARRWVRLIVGHDNDIAAVITLSHVLNSSSGSAP